VPDLAGRGLLPTARYPVPVPEALFACISLDLHPLRPPAGRNPMTLTMTPAERESFLAEPHVGVLSVGLAEQGPLTVPVWYSYEPGGMLSVITARASSKERAIERAGRFSLCAQTETAPYKYVTVEGAVTRTDPEVDPDERRAMAHRYLGAELGDLYIEATQAEAEQNVVIRMKPQRWWSVDYAKQFA
jgi:PPOX class probable F420-dependent enzyme